VGDIQIVMAREDIPSRPSVFLAGPTPKQGSGTPSWRPAAADALAAAWDRAAPLVVLNPESRGGVRADRYEDQVDWEMSARRQAHVILFWVPRDLDLLPGFTTNTEFGYDVALGRSVVLGSPSDCPNPELNRYLEYLAQWHRAPIRRHLRGAAATAVRLVTRQV
jgi:hypothetical protein